MALKWLTFWGGEHRCSRITQQQQSFKGRPRPRRRPTRETNSSDVVFLFLALIILLYLCILQYTTTNSSQTTLRRKSSCERSTGISGQSFELDFHIEAEISIVHLLHKKGGMKLMARHFYSLNCTTHEIYIPDLLGVSFDIFLLLLIFA